MKNFIPVIVVSFLFPFFSAGAQAASLGAPAPAFEARDVEGHPQSLGRHEGKIVVLEWHNPECPFVKKHYETGNMQALQSYAVKHDIVWLTVNSGAPGKQGALSAEEAKAYVKAQKAYPTAYILDPEGALGRLYGATATPHMFVIDAQGRLAYAGAIDDKRGVDKAEVRAARNYVMEALDALNAGKSPEVSSTSAYGCSVKYRDD